MSENLGGGPWRRLCAVLVAAWLTVGCAGPDSKHEQTRTPADTAAEKMGAALQHVSTVAMHARRELTENSAAAMSTRQPGVLFTINDSGHDALLFAIDTTGADRGVWRVIGATNVDWESTSIGSCGVARPDASCVYIGDTGDNVGSHPWRVIYRVAEPVASGATDTVRAEELRYAYADARHDVEAMYVAPNGDTFLITKRPIADGAGHLRRALVFRLPAAAWRARGVTMAQLVDSLPIVPGSIPLRSITDASLSPDARHLAVRTYSQVYVFATDSLSGVVNRAVTPTVCDLTPLGERQGEGVTWANARGRLVFTSEGRNEPLRIGDCQLP
jgi:hypothetical protein